MFAPVVTATEMKVCRVAENFRDLTPVADAPGRIGMGNHRNYGECIGEHD